LVNVASSLPSYTEDLHPSSAMTFLFYLLLFALLVSCVAAESRTKRYGLPLLPAIISRGGEAHADKNSHHEIVEEKLLFSRWRTLKSRLVRFPDGREVDFDIVGQAGSDRAVLIFAWNSHTKTATLIREYMPAGNAVKYGIAAGLVEDKHKNGTDCDNDSKLTAAKSELEEECHLVGGTWIQLTEDTLMDKCK